MQSNYLERAKAIGGPIAEAFAAEALRNCVRLQYEYNMSLVYAVLKQKNFEAFQRACSGAEMVWA